MSTIEINQFEKKMQIRNIQLEDIDAILALQTLCFAGMIPWERAHLESPSGYFSRGAVLCRV